VLPALVAAYVEATNSFDLERLLATFADDALVNDQLRDYWGKSAIRKWAERDIIGERLTMVTGAKVWAALRIRRIAFVL
jgi:ketosteroid isomerase-like protein